MSEAILPLIHNAALLLAIVLLYTLVRQRRRYGLSRVSKWLSGSLLGAILGGIGIAVMMSSWVYREGIIFDTRSVLLCISGLFFGTIPTLIAMLMTAAYRLYLGGSAAIMGISVIVASGMLGIAWRRQLHLRRRALKELRWHQLYALGLVVHLVMLALTFTLSFDTVLPLLAVLAGPVMIVYPVATAALGLLLVNSLRREHDSQELRRSRREIEATLYGIGDGVIAADAQGKLVRMNPVASQLTGWTEVEARGKPLPEVFQIVNEVTGLEVENPTCRVLKEGHVVGLANHTCLIAKDGTSRPIADSGAPIHGDNGEIVGAVLVFRDQSHEREKHAQLEISESRFRALFEQAAAGVAQMDTTTGRFVKVNRRYAEILGYTTEELLQLSLRDIVHEQDLHETLAYLEGLLKGQLPELRRQIRYRHKEGHTIWISLAAAPISVSGETAIHHVAVVQDITRRMLLEERRELSMRIITTLNSGKDLTVQIDQVLTMLKQGLNAEAAAIRLQSYDGQSSFNAASCEPDDDGMAHSLCHGFGDRIEGTVTPDDAPLPCICAHILHGKIDPSVPGFAPDGTFCTGDSSHCLTTLPATPHRLLTPRNCLRAGYQSLAIVPLHVGEETIGLLQLGSRRLNAFDREVVEYLESIGASIAIALDRRRSESRALAAQAETQRLLLNAEKSRLALLSIMEDQKRSEDERETLRQQLFQAQKIESIGRLAGGVAHDFNNMLNVILGRAQIAAMKIPSNSQAFADLQEIEQAARRSAELTRQLLAFARKEAIRPKRLDLNEVIAGTLKMLQRLLGEGICLEWRPGSNLWPVCMDPAQVDQILANLTVNARDAMNGIGSIHISTANTVLTESTVMEGETVPPGDYVKITVTDTGCGMSKEVMEQLFEPFFTTKEIGRGTGLGLATIYGAVRQNNGAIQVHSKTGEGATFRMFLPRAHGAVDSDRPSSDRHNARGAETILLVEDEPAILHLTSETLAIHGYRVLPASTAEEAMRIAHEHPEPIHLLFTDVVMPHMNGKELAEHVARLRPEIKILYSSGYTADIVASHGIIESGIHFIQKPYPVQEIVKRVREVLDTLMPAAD